VRSIADGKRLISIIDRNGRWVLVPSKYEPEDLFRDRPKLTGPLPWLLAVKTLDTNVVVRLLIGDDPQQPPIAERAFLDAIASGGVVLPDVAVGAAGAHPGCGGGCLSLIHI